LHSDLRELRFRMKAQQIQVHLLSFQLRLDGEAVPSGTGPGRFVAPDACNTWNYYPAEILRLALGLQEFDGDVVEGEIGIVAGDVGEVARGVAELAVGHDEMGFGFALDGVDDVGGAERNVEVGDVVLMEKRGFVGGDRYAEDADVFVFEDKVVVGFFGDGNSFRSLSAQRKCKQEQE